MNEKQTQIVVELDVVKICGCDSFVAVLMIVAPKIIRIKNNFVLSTHGYLIFSSVFLLLCTFLYRILTRRRLSSLGIITYKLIVLFQSDASLLVLLFPIGWPPYLHRPSLGTAGPPSPPPRQRRPASLARG
jgi:hypothetical protein